MRRRIAILAGRARQPGIGTVGVIGTFALVLLAVAALAVPSAARRTVMHAPAAAVLPLSEPFARPAAEPADVRLTVTAPETIRAPAGGVLEARSVPVLVGTLAVFETHSPSGWTPVASARFDAAGRAAARWVPSRYGAVEVRARVDGVGTSASAWTVAVRRDARVFTWRSWVEEPGWDRAAFEAEVSRILADPRGWGATGEVSFRHITSGTPRMWVKLATPRTTDRLCAPTKTRGIWNCRAGNSVVVNADRWFGGRASWPGSLADYRALIVNHETGHVLGFRHAGCPGRGASAPVMQQQGVSLGGCRPNPWPLAAELRRL